jgi:hypothetical protein
MNMKAFAVACRGTRRFSLIIYQRFQGGSSLARQLLFVISHNTVYHSDWLVRGWRRIHVQPNVEQ